MVQQKEADGKIWMEIILTFGIFWHKATNLELIAKALPIASGNGP